MREREFLKNKWDAKTRGSFAVVVAVLFLWDRDVNPLASRCAGTPGTPDREAERAWTEYGSPVNNLNA